MEYSNFNEYPHKIYATAFLVNGELADYKICNYKRSWETRTFRGSNWENEIYANGFIDNNNLTCKYKEIIVNNDEEHNKGFEMLEDWLFNNFKLYEKANLKRF